MLVLNNVKFFEIVNKTVKLFLTDNSDYKNLLDINGLNVLLSKQGIIISFESKNTNFSLDKEKTYNFTIKRKYDSNDNVYYQILQIEESEINSKIIKELNDDDDPEPDYELIESMYNSYYDEIMKKIEIINKQLKEVGNVKNMENMNKLYDILQNNFSYFSEKNNV